MPAFVKTERDEELWSKAKKIAERRGRKEDWAYITGIYNNMKGGSEKAAALICKYCRRSHGG